MGPEIAIVAVIIIVLAVGFGIGAIGNLLHRTAASLARAERAERDRAARRPK